MARRYISLVILLMIAPFCEAAQVCTTIDTSTWTPSQKQARFAIAYNLEYTASGQDLPPTITRDQVCFLDPIFDVPTVINATTILNKFALDDAASQAAALLSRQRLQAAQTEISANPVESADLSTIDAQIDSLSSMADLKVFLKKLSRDVVAQRLIRGQ